MKALSDQEWNIYPCEFFKLIIFIYGFNAKVTCPFHVYYKQWKNFQNTDIYIKGKELDQSIGLDFLYDKKKQGGVIKDDRGQWDHPGEITEIQGNNMATHGYGNIPLYVVPDVGEPRIVEANTGNHTFPGATKFTEYPIKKKKNGGWLDKY